MGDLSALWAKRSELKAREAALGDAIDVEAAAAMVSGDRSALMAAEDELGLFAPELAECERRILDLEPSNHAVLRMQAAIVAGAPNEYRDEAMAIVRAVAKLAA